LPAANLASAVVLRGAMELVRRLGPVEAHPVLFLFCVVVVVCRAGAPGAARSPTGGAAGPIARGISQPQVYTQQQP
jgi:hypothetical protein